MKKILFWLVALVATMSMNAQNAKVMKVLDGETVLKTYEVKTTLKVVYEDAPTTGTAEATISGSTVNVTWVQLWAGGPKFAEKNVGAGNYTDVGTTMSSTEAAKTGEAYVWGANWRTPSYDDMDELQKATSNTGSTKVTCTYTQENGVWGFKFTGIESGYTENSVFFPAQYGSSYSGYADYLAVTRIVDDTTPWDMYLNNSNGTWNSDWHAHPQGTCLVRPVLK